MPMMTLLFVSLLAIASPDSRVCDQYLDLANQYRCQGTNYFVDFGYRYCLKFIKHNDHFSVEGQKKLELIRSCLIDTLKADRELTCANSIQRGYASHIPCYLENGFCEMRLMDKLEILNVTKSELPDKEYRKTMKVIRARCK